MLNLLKPAPFIKKTQDTEQVKREYKYWRIRTFYGMYIGYAFYYLTRKSFTFAIPSLVEEGYSLTQLGILGSIFSITYGISKFVSGVMGDRSNPRYFMAIGLMLTGVFNIAFGCSSALFFFALFWGLNAWFQGWGWPGCAKLLTHWYAQSERGRWWSAWNTAHNLGGALIPLIIAFCVYCYGWRFSMFVPGILCIGVGFFLINRLRDIPQTIGLPQIEVFRNERIDEAAIEKDNDPLPVKRLLFDYVICNRAIWVMAISYFFIYIIRIGINDWAMLYFVAKGYSKLKAASCIFWFEVGGFIGSLTSGWISDMMFGGKRNPVNTLFTLGAIGSLVGLHWNGIHSLFLDSFMIFWTGFFIFGPQMLVGMLAAELPDKRAAATASGFAGCFAYLGAAAAGGPLGAFTQEWGWTGFFLVLIASGIISIGLIAPLWSLKRASPSSDDSLIIKSAPRTADCDD